MVVKTRKPNSWKTLIWSNLFCFHTQSPVQKETYIWSLDSPQDHVWQQGTQKITCCNFLIRKPCFVGTHGNLLLVTISQAAFLLLAKFCEIYLFIFLKWEKNSKNHHISSIFDFHFVAKKSIEGWLNICCSYLVCL